MLFNLLNTDVLMIFSARRETFEDSDDLSLDDSGTSPIGHHREFCLSHLDVSMHIVGDEAVVLHLHLGYYS